MYNPSYFLILLTIECVITLLFLLFSIFYSKKFFTLSSISNIFVVITLLFMLLYKYFNENWILKGLAAVSFDFSIMFSYNAIADVINMKIKTKHKLTAIFILILDFFSYPFFIEISIFIHKILFMSIYIYFALRILKTDIKKRLKYLLSTLMILFSSIQFGYAFYWFFISKSFFFIDNLLYLIQCFSLSVVYLFTVLEIENSSLNTKLESVEKDFYEMDKFKNDYFANISHELRTPITIIFSSIQLLEASIKKGPTSNVNSEKYLYGIKKNCYKLTRLVNNIIDMNKIETGHANLNIQNYDIVPILEDIAASVTPFAKQKNIELLFDTEFETQIISCDIEKIERVFLNILSNAIKYTPNGGNIIVYIYKSENLIFISVKDTGTGIPEELHKSIFDRFVQNNSNLSHNGFAQSSGIGLSLVKSLVEAHDGTITIDKQYKDGSNFIISLPIRTIENADVVSREISENNIFIEFSDINC